MTRHGIARALHRLALRAYPDQFRREFGDELERCFVQRLDRASSRWRAAVLAGFELADGLISGAAERVRHRRRQPAGGHHHFAMKAAGNQIMTWDSLRADIRLAIRQCVRTPLFAILTIFSL